MYNQIKNDIIKYLNNYILFTTIIGYKIIHATWHNMRGHNQQYDSQASPVSTQSLKLF